MPWFPRAMFRPESQSNGHHKADDEGHNNDDWISIRVDFQVDLHALVSTHRYRQSRMLESRQGWLSSTSAIAFQASGEFSSTSKCFFK